MRPYIISHMMTSVDGRIDCPMVGQLSTDEYYIALEKLGPCSKLSGRITPHSNVLPSKRKVLRWRELR